MVFKLVGLGSGWFWIIWDRPQPHSHTGPMCLEGLEEASGESSSESLKKSGRQFEAVGQGGGFLTNLFWFWGGFFEMGWFVENSWSEGEVFEKRCWKDWKVVLGV